MDPQNVRSRLVSYLEQGNAHAPLREATAEVPREHRCATPDFLPYAIWDLVEHIRIAQWDVVAFSAGPDHESPDFPDGYWPEETDSVSDDAWNRSLEEIERDKQKMIDLIQTPDRDLTDPFPWGDGQTLLKEAQVLIDHRSYHTGQIITIRRYLDIWPADSSFSV